MDTPKCLIVDDDEIMLALVAGMLGEESYQCTTALNAEKALNLLKKESFDIMITDISMDTMDGIELTQKAKDLYEDMPVIIMTSFHDEYTYDAAVNAGASDFLKKPFTQKEIVTRIARINRDAQIIASLKEKEKSIRSIRSEMASGGQESAQKKLLELEKAMKQLRQLNKQNYFL